MDPKYEILMDILDKEFFIYAFYKTSKYEQFEFANYKEIVKVIIRPEINVSKRINYSIPYFLDRDESLDLINFLQNPDIPDNICIIVKSYYSITLWSETAQKEIKKSGEDIRRKILSSGCFNNIPVEIINIISCYTGSIFMNNLYREIYKQ